jgi:hypothetical protein
MSEGGDLEAELTPKDALRQIGEVDRRTRQPARTVGLFYLVLGLATITLWPVLSLGPTWSRAVASALWIAFAIVLTWHVGRMRVLYREFTWADRRYRLATIVFCIALSTAGAVGTVLRPEEPGGGWAVALVTLSVCASVPIFYLAWRALREER